MSAHPRGLHGRRGDRPDLFTFYRSIGINLKQLYGQTETLLVCLQPDGEARADTVGKPIAGVEVRISDNGEILVKADAQGLLQEPRRHRRVMNADGYCTTGDAGFFDADGHLKIIDRAKDVGKWRHADGPCSRPNTSRTSSSSSSTSREAVAFGDGSASAAAFINIDLEAVGNWAEKKATYSGYTDLAGKPEVLQADPRLRREGQRRPRRRPLSGSQISRFLILHKPRRRRRRAHAALQVRRSAVAERYRC